MMILFWWLAMRRALTMCVVMKRPRSLCFGFTTWPRVLELFACSVHTYWWLRIEDQHCYLTSKLVLKVLRCRKLMGTSWASALLRVCLLFFLTWLTPFRPQHLCVPRHAPAPPLQASQNSASAAGDVGLDLEVSRVVVIGCCDAHPHHLSQKQPHRTYRCL